MFLPVLGKYGAQLASDKDRQRNEYLLKEKLVKAPEFSLILLLRNILQYWSKNIAALLKYFSYIKNIKHLNRLECQCFNINVQKIKFFCLADEKNLKDLIEPFNDSLVSGRSVT